MEWEYKNKVFSLPGVWSSEKQEQSIDSTFNDLGKEGWELAQVMYSDEDGATGIGSRMAIFKRPKA